ncbi:MAG: hypothetical protein ABIH39_06945 [Candidatus Margulisiibacteriota bacterium]
MKKSLVLILAILLFVSSAFSAVFRTGETILVDKHESIMGNLFAVGKTVIIKGKVYGDIITIGSDVVLEGEVHGDILAAGGRVNINVPTVSDVRVVGGEVKLRSQVRGEVFAAGGNIDIAPDNTIVRDLVVYAGQIHVGGKIYGDANLNGADIAILEKTLINGELSGNASNGDIRIASSAVITGPKNIVKKAQKAKNIKKDFMGVIAIGKLLGFLATIVFALLLILTMPNYIRSVNSTMITKPWGSIGIGIITLLLVPVAVFLCLVSIIGIPIGLIILFAYSLGIYSTKVFISIGLGSLILSKLEKTDKPSLVWSLVLGTIVYTVLLKLPFVGWIICFVGLLLGLGALLITKKESLKMMIDKGII